MSTALRRWYWALALLLSLAVWTGVALALLPRRDADGSYAAKPYGLSTGLEDKALDLLFQLRDALRPEQRKRGLVEPITVVEIDEKAIKASGVRLQQWRRDWYARLIDRANKGGAIVIGLDVLLSEEGGTATEYKGYDQVLAKALAEAGSVVVAAKLAAGGTPAVTPLPLFSNAAYTIGFVDIPPDGDGFVRSSQLVRAVSGADTEISFPTRLAEAYLASRTPEGEAPPLLTPLDNENMRLGQRVLPLRNDRNLQIDFRGRPHTHGSSEGDSNSRPPAFRHVSAADVLDDSTSLPDDLFRDRIVLIGVDVIDSDRFPTPFYEPSVLAHLFDRNLPGNNEYTPGVELHANTVATILFGQTPIRPHYRWQIFALLLPLGLAAFAVFRLRASWGLLTVLAIAGLTLVVSVWSFNAHGFILPLASAWLGLAIMTPFGLGLRYAHERVLRDEKEAERAQVMDILSRVVSEDVAEELWERRDQIMSGERRIVTLIFTDIRNFTTLSESAPSDQVVIWLNDYFSRMQTIIERRGGHINKFLGDGLMIVFGAPESRGDATEAQEAVACGLEMLAAVEKMNKDWQGTSRPVVKIGVGIHTGDATCGVVGSERRLEYTIIGDTVNLASRLESTTKEYGVPLLASNATVSLLDHKYDSRPLGEVKVKGKHEPTKIFAVMGKETEAKQALPAAAVQ